MKNKEEIKTVLKEAINMEETKIANSLCEERGHVIGDTCLTTAMYCPPRLEDTDCHTRVVYPACNITSYTCKRCGESIREKEKERYSYKWKSPDCPH